MVQCAVAVHDKIFELTLLLDFVDRCHSLGSLHLPSAALTSLPGLSPTVRFRRVIKYGIPRWGIPYFGAGDRTRTGTLSPAVDFESTTSTNSITPAGAKIVYYIFLKIASRN